MASGQSKEVSRKVLDGDSAKRDLRRRDKAALLGLGRGRSAMGKALNSSPKASFRKGAEGVTICASAKGGSGGWGKGWMMAWKEASFKT